MYSCPSLPPLRGVVPFPRAPPRSGGGLPVRSRCSLSALLPYAFRAARRYAPRPLLRCPRRYALAPLLAPRFAAPLCARRRLRQSSVGLFVPAGTPPTSVGLQSFRTAVRFICLSADCLRPYWARPQLRGHSGGVPRPALSRSGGPPPLLAPPLAPSRSPRHGGRGYGRAVVGLRPPLFCRLPPAPSTALSRYRSGCHSAPWRWSSTLPRLQVVAPSRWSDAFGCALRLPLTSRRRSRFAPTRHSATCPPASAARPPRGFGGCLPH